jgi:hypothetical protein
MKRLVVVAVLLCGVIVPAAQAAPSMSIDQVVAPSGPAPDLLPSSPTTWHVGLSGIDAWDYADCSSTAHYQPLATIPGDDEYYVRQGTDVAPNWGSWSFKTDDTPVEFVRNPGGGETLTYLPLARIDGSCDLTRTVYVGRRYYRRGQNLYRNGSATSQRGGCPTHRYADGELMIDCRHSRTSGYLTWSFKLRPSDRDRGAIVSSSSTRPTMGHRRVWQLRLWNTVFVTEKVSPGVVATVEGVGLHVSRVYSRKVYRHDRKTLSATWPA